jgi:CHAT domain-containing protein
LTLKADGLGPRRAFRLAGVRSLVTSLWKVGDDDARIWMHAFYSQLAANQRSSGLAAWAVTGHALAQHRAARGDPDPIYWAGFVATGY